VLAGTSDHARVPSKPHHLRFRVLACLCALSLELWRRIFELDAVLTGIVDGGLQLGAHLFIATTSSAAACMASTAESTSEPRAQSEAQSGDVGEEGLALLVRAADHPEGADAGWQHREQ